MQTAAICHCSICLPDPKKKRTHQYRLSCCSCILQYFPINIMQFTQYWFHTKVSIYTKKTFILFHHTRERKDKEQLDGGASPGGRALLYPEDLINDGAVLIGIAIQLGSTQYAAGWCGKPNSTAQLQHTFSSSWCTWPGTGQVVSILDIPLNHYALQNVRDGQNS